MTHKICVACGEKKPLEDFYPRKDRAAGRVSRCRMCSREYGRAWGQRHRTKCSAYSKKWYEKNRQQCAINHTKWATKNHSKILAKARLWRDAHPEYRGYARAKAEQWRRENTHRFRKSVRDWQRSHPERVNAYAAARKLSRMNATPLWANKEIISEFYAVASIRTRLTGKSHHVDHVVPIVSKRVCGLHVEGNLQILLGPDNSGKGNRHWPDMPDRLAGLSAAR